MNCCFIMFPEQGRGDRKRALFKWVSAPSSKGHCWMVWGGGKHSVCGGNLKLDKFARNWQPIGVGGKSIIDKCHEGWSSKRIVDLCQYIECLNWVKKSGQFSTIRLVKVAMPQILGPLDSLDDPLYYYPQFQSRSNPLLLLLTHQL
jgi:hypothetical protein